MSVERMMQQMMLSLGEVRITGNPAKRINQEMFDLGSSIFEIGSKIEHRSS
jgi:hypothetical protein